MTLVNLPPEIANYIAYVRAATVPQCKDQIALCNHVERCFASEDIYVDENQLHRYLAQQKYFPFKLLSWEIFIFTLHNCTYWRESGLLRWPNLLALVGRGAGKNGYLAFESFCWITPINGVPKYDVDIFATSEDQARTSPDDVRDVLDTHKSTLEKYFHWNSECITNKKTKSRIRFRTSGFKTKDGGRPGAVVFDEYHAYEDYRMVDVATTGLGKKPLPRKTIITTDGNIRGGPLDDLKRLAEDILYRGQDDGGLIPFICRLDSPDEVDNLLMWHKANPSLTHFPVLMQQLISEYTSYKQKPSAAASFMSKRMNLPPERLEDDVTEWSNVLAANKPLPDLRGMPCVAGIDYAKTTDFVAAGLLFKKEGIYYWLSHTWVCRASYDLPAIKAPLDKWAEMGLLTFVDAPEISPSIVAEWLEEMGEIYDISYIGMDGFRYTWIAKALKNCGFDTDRGGRNNILLTKRVTVMRWAPVITSIFLNQSIVWGENNELMNWYINNTYVTANDDGNMYYLKKEKKSRKTDGFMALVSAVCASESLQDCEDDSGEYEPTQVYSY